MLGNCGGETKGSKVAINYHIMQQNKSSHKAHLYFLQNYVGSGLVVVIKTNFGSTSLNLYTPTQDW